MISAHAADEAPNECCGLVVQRAGDRKFRLVRAKNLARFPRQHFDLDPDAWLEVGSDEAVIGIYHSHTTAPATPSLADRAMCNATNLPWHIVSWPAGDYCRIEPDGTQVPLERRPYVWAVHDCYSLARDWYDQVWGLKLADFSRQPLLRGENTFLREYEGQGFVRLIDQLPQVGDAFLYQFGTSLPHVALYVDDNVILHHPEGRLSYRETYDGLWRKHTHHLRHRSRMGDAA
jgi:proteasome lid subunit RPN8/RPN11